MLILAKSVLSLMIGFLATLFLGVVIVPILRKKHIGQRVSVYLEDSHKKKDGTPTMGGIIFILGTFISILTLLLLDKMEFTPNLFIVLFVFVSYALIGLLDDYLSIKRDTNVGLTAMQKLFLQLIVAVVFFFIYMKSGNNPVLEIYTLNIKIDMGWFYGFFLLFIMLGGSNAVNLTDGLDGLAGGLSAIAFLTFGIIAWGSGWVDGYQDIAVFCFILVGSLLGFLIFNTYPAKVFMGDTGSLALGGFVAGTAYVLQIPILIPVFGFIYMVEVLSVIIQVTYFKKTGGKRFFKMAPIHHHFELCGWSETQIVALFTVVTALLCLICLYGL